VLTPLIDQFSNALTPRRLTAHAALIAIALWSVFAWDYSTLGLLDRNGLLKGTDFLHFYTIGTLAREHRFAELYDIRAQAKLAGERVPEAKGLIYLPLYGPQVALLFAPLAGLPYGTALAVWMLINAALYAICCGIVWRECRALKRARVPVILAALAFPAFFHLLTWGQTSGIALLCFTLMFLAFQHGRNFFAGLAFGLLFFKPQLGLAGFVIFLLAREWRVLIGATITAVGQLAIAWPIVGPETMRRYLLSGAQIPQTIRLLEPKLYQLHSLKGFWELLIPWPILSAILFGISTVIALAIGFRVWQYSRSLALRFSALLLTTVLVSPHLTIYDLVLLAPMFLLLTDWAVKFPNGSSSMRVLLYLCFVLPLAGPLARWTHVQLTVIMMFALLLVIEKTVRTADWKAAH
jgi:arabinofuranan 3-O-arabinosyltransferase